MKFENHTPRSPYEGVDMKTHNPEAINIATKEILALAQTQNPTGRTDSEGSFFQSLIEQMRNSEITPEAAILKARAQGDARQDGHGGGSIQDGY